MIRKQIYLTPEIDRELEFTARLEGKSEAEIVRRILRKGLNLKKQEKNPSSLLLDLAAKAVKKGPGDLSTNLFDYLYGDKSPNYGKRKKTFR